MYYNFNLNTYGVCPSTLYLDWIGQFAFPLDILVTARWWRHFHPSPPSLYLILKNEFTILTSLVFLEAHSSLHLYCLKNRKKKVFSIFLWGFLKSNLWIEEGKVHWWENAPYIYMPNLLPKLCLYNLGIHSNLLNLTLVNTTPWKLHHILVLEFSTRKKHITFMWNGKPHGTLLELLRTCEKSLETIFNNMTPH